MGCDAMPGQRAIPKLLYAWMARIPDVVALSGRHGSCQLWGAYRAPVLAGMAARHSLRQIEMFLLPSGFSLSRDKGVRWWAGVSKRPRSTNAGVARSPAFVWKKEEKN